ncbi:acyltransferase family protein [Cryobacterium melibiosiphilum]|uniref:acyltransferase family protein n=1 Tax=Cryobacterium melibiosiphilum TaxID=995039 RepID=UPI0013142D12|nr:acyltransferase [Cryobacterium melibiosiphilum]
MATLDEAFNPRRNSLNALRLVLAALVIVSHAWIIGGYGYPPALMGVDIGMFAVCGFFAISGYLIAASRLSASRLSSLSRHAGGSRPPRADLQTEPGLLAFLLRRFLRIYPAFLTVLLVTAVIFAPLSTLLASTDTPAPSYPSAASYVVANLSLHITQWGIDGTLLTARIPTWNIPLWSLVFEALCYLALGLLASVVPRRFFTPAAVTLFAGITLAAVLTRPFGSAGFTDNLLALGSFFFAGVVLYLFRQRMPSSAPLALIAAGMVLLLLALGFFKPLAAFPLAYLLLYLGAVLPLHRIGARNDISYGLYVYGFPVQQLLLLATQSLTENPMPVAVFATLSVVATIPFALASWFLVERPALTLKRFAASRVAPAPAPART